MIHRFLAHGDQDRWGKRRAKPAVVNRWMEDVLHELRESGGDAAVAEVARLAASGPQAEAPATLGLEVHGPGGGAWTVELGEDGSVATHRGRPAAGATILTLEPSQLIQYARQALATPGMTRRRRPAGVAADVVRT